MKMRHGAMWLLKGTMATARRLRGPAKGTRTAHKPPPASRAMTRQPARAMRICWT